MKDNKQRFSKRGSNKDRRNFKNKKGSGGGYQKNPRFNNNRNNKSRGNRGSRGDRINIPLEKLFNKRQEGEVEAEFKPMFRIEDLPIDDRLKQNVISKGFKNLTPIQDQAIPASVIGQDVVGIADTGSGKTAAFLIPAINKTIQDPKKNVLIITPTRELALQINKEFRDLAKGLNIFSAVCIGGTNMKNQVFFLRKKHNFVIGTPGRILDLVRTKNLKLNNTHTLILDEVDRMLDMGFIDDVKEIINNVPSYRQTLFYSATNSKPVYNLMRKFLAVDHATFSVKKRDTSKNVDQDIIEVTINDSKEEVLLSILNQDNVEKTIVFVRTKRFAEKLTSYLQKNKMKVVSLHGDKSQNQRKRSLELFKQDKVDILVATDVAARGLDIPDVSHVINYDLPENYEDYIHRVGRTGRADNVGSALNFVDHKKLTNREREELSKIKSS